MRHKSLDGRPGSDVQDDRLVLAAVAVADEKTDIQIGIAATGVIGAVILFGQVAILGGRKAIRKALGDR